MQKFIKQNITLILAFLLPLLLIFVVAINAYFPSLFFKTDYNFVYSTCDEVSYGYEFGCESYAKSLYSIKNNQIIQNTVDRKQDSDSDGTPDVKENYKVRLFLHNTEENESTEILLTQAQQMKFNSLLTSPDDVTIAGSYNSGSDFFLFSNGSSYGYYLSKGKLKSKLNLINDDRYYAQGNFHFIGWVLK
jgi:hypothetical protein